VSSETVKPGQVWADNDKRSKGRTLRVDRIDGTYAVCTILTNDRKVQALIDDGGLTWYRPVDKRGRSARIRLDRFRPTSTGYRLVSDAS
jgi:hypothetical protein